MVLGRVPGLGLFASEKRGRLDGDVKTGLVTHSYPIPTKNFVPTDFIDFIAAPSYT